MTHSPPIPAGNTSPYPLKERPHVHVDRPSSDMVNADRSNGKGTGGALLGLGAALIVGVALTALLVARRKPAPAPVKRRKQKADRAAPTSQHSGTS